MVFSTLRRLEKRNRVGVRMGTSSGSTETTTEVACLERLAARSLLRYLAAPIVTAFTLWMEFLMKVNRCSSSSGRTSVGIEKTANCSPNPMSFFIFCIFYHVLCINNLWEQRLRAALAMVKKEPHPLFFLQPAPGKKPSTQVSLVLDQPHISRAK